MDDPVGLDVWAAQVPAEMRDDPIWRLPAYRFALYLGDLVQTNDLPHIRRDFRTRRHVDQLLDAVQSISANIAEGYGRTSGRERAKFYEYAESTAREARDWLFKVRCALPPHVANERIALVTRIMRILRTAIIRERMDSTSRARRASESTGLRASETSGRGTDVRPATSTSDQRPAR